MDDQTTNEDLQTTREGLGLAKTYKLGFRVTQDLADIRSDVARGLIVPVHDFGIAAGAAEGLALLDQLSATFAGVERVDGTGAMTTNAVIVRTPPSDPTCPVAQVSIVLQVDQMLALVEVIDYEIRNRGRKSLKRSPLCPPAASQPVWQGPRLG